MPTFKSSTRKNTNEPIFKRRSPGAQRSASNIKSSIDSYQKISEADGKKRDIESLVSNFQRNLRADEPGGQKRKLSIDNVVSSFEKSMTGGGFQSQPAGGFQSQPASLGAPPQNPAASKTQNALAAFEADMDTGAKREMMERILAKVSANPERQGDVQLLKQALGDSSQRGATDLAAEVERAMGSIVDARRRAQDMQASSSSPSGFDMSAQEKIQQASQQLAELAAQRQPAINSRLTPDLRAALLRGKQELLGSTTARGSGRSPSDIVAAAEKCKAAVEECHAKLGSIKNAVKSGAQDTASDMFKSQIDALQAMQLGAASQALDASMLLQAQALVAPTLGTDMSMFAGVLPQQDVAAQLALSAGMSAAQPDGSAGGEADAEKKGTLEIWDGDWTCPSCKTLVFSWRDRCGVCRAPRELGEAPEVAYHGWEGQGE